MTDQENYSQRDGQKSSLWQSAGKCGTDAGVLPAASSYDVIIAGAGITGVTTALLLQQQGKSCLVLEAASLGFGTTGGTSAHLNTFFDATYPEVESDFSVDSSRLLAHAGKQAIKEILSLSQTYGIDCDFAYKDAYLFSQDEKESKELARILDASKRAGLQVEDAKVNGCSIPFDKSVRFADQAQFHPMKYLNGLAIAYAGLGGRLREGARVTKTEKADDGVTVWCGDEVYRCKHFVWATHIPPGVNQFSFKCAPYRSYILAMTLKNDVYPDSLIYDMKEPYHYIRTHELDGTKYLIVGGEDHKTGHGNPEQAMETLKEYVNSHFDVAEIVYSWSSQYYVPVDGLPYIGELSSSDQKIFVATGFNGNGIIMGTVSARLISDQVLGKTNPYVSLFTPGRIKPIAGFTEFVRESADVAYHFIADRFSSEDLDKLSDLKREDGKIVDYDGNKLAIYKDAQGQITAFSPVCTHAGCIVQFNAVEKSWDCPCHGGRFDLSGNVISGPPLEHLKPIKIS